jgi:hypothetical protein
MPVFCRAALQTAYTPVAITVFIAVFTPSATPD